MFVENARKKIGRKLGREEENDEKKAEGRKR
jgi:hypothetical protein